MSDEVKSTPVEVKRFQFAPPVQDYKCSVILCNNVPRGWIPISSPVRQLRMIAICDAHAIQAHEIIDQAITTGQDLEHEALQEIGRVIEMAFIKATMIELDKLEKPTE